MSDNEEIAQEDDDATAVVDLATELSFMTFSCEDDEGDVYSGILTADEDGRDIWKDHPASEAEGCTYPTIDFFFGILTDEVRNCDVEVDGDSDSKDEIDLSSSDEDEEEEIPVSVTVEGGSSSSSKDESSAFVAPIMLSAVSAAS